jgi:predicted 3-demethylubiquinone-9 3-methyltransferase (glyoxalase superfamily)
MPARQKISTCLRFDGKAEEAARYYCSIFKRSRTLGLTRYGAAGPGPEGSVMTATFRLEGQEFVALDGGPQFKCTEAISLVVSCRTQPEVDALWSKLARGGAEGPCGWLKDR